MDTIVYLDPRSLHPMPNQPRTSIDEAKVRGLAQTFEEKGFKGAITVWYPQPNHVEIISGHRSHMAFLIVAQKYNYSPPWDKIPCAAFENINEAKAYELAVLYNEKREDLTLLELAMSWDRLIHKYSYAVEQLARDFETSPSTVYNTISVLNEPEYILDAIRNGLLTLPDILGLRRIKDERERKKIVMQLIAGEIAKADLPGIASRLNRQSQVLALIPGLASDLESSTEKGTTARMEIFIPKDFKLYFTFAASTRIDWELLPQRNILVSGYHVLHRSGKQAMVVDMINKRNKMDSLMIDSAGIVAMGCGDTDWFNRQPELVEFANAVEADVVSHLDVLCKTHLLINCKMTLKEAQEITIRNARQMMDLKTKARKCYVLQGHTAEEYQVCIDAFKNFGIFDVDTYIIGVGSQAGERRKITTERYKYVCDRIKSLNPKLGIHAFGIGSPWTLVQLYHMGVTQADNATPQVLTQTNQWIDSRTGEIAKNINLSNERIGAMFQAQLLYNYAAYFMGLNNEFKRGK
jgi:ParB/RepB/Spo0J family partition protein